MNDTTFSTGTQKRAAPSDADADADVAGTETT
jgi:hypothetical protein